MAKEEDIVSNDTSAVLNRFKILGYRKRKNLFKIHNIENKAWPCRKN